MIKERLVIGNWKMHCNLPDAVVLATKIRNGMDKIPSDVMVVLCPPTVWLYPVAEILEHSSNNLQLGAQNIWPGQEGKFSGEVSAWMIAQMCQYVIIGHSERRVHHLEDNQLINKKVASALRFGLKPILCIGEFRRLVADKNGRLKHRKGDTASDIFTQVRDGLMGLTLDEIKQIIIAYEPIWAIGTNQAADLHYVEEVIRQIRLEIDKYVGAKVAHEMMILYGGSVTSETVNRYAHSREIDGVLPGGSSLKADEFIKIASSFHLRGS